MKKSSLYYTIACAVLILAGLLVSSRTHEALSPPDRSLADFPLDLKSYYGIDIRPVDDYHYDDPMADEKILRVYKDRNKEKSIYFFAGHWDNQNEKKKITSPLYTRDGWGYYWARNKVLSSGSSRLNVKEFLNEKGLQKELVYYCYIINETTVSNEYYFKAMNMMNLLLRGRNNAMLVRISMPVTDEWPLEKAEAHEEQFIMDVMPLLFEHI
ncbi:MAG: EpsI family protein [Nitrospirae bacterium]|nr:EpsI family protein [Nitrospirota bacterium]